MDLGNGREKCYNVVAHCKVKSFIEKDRKVYFLFSGQRVVFDRGKILMILFFTFGSVGCTLTPFSPLLFCFVFGLVFDTHVEVEILSFSYLYLFFPFFPPHPL